MALDTVTPGKGWLFYMKIAKLLYRKAAKSTVSGVLPLVVASVLVTRNTEAQNLLWANNYSGVPVSGLEEVEGVVADSSGNVFATGLSGTKGIGSVIRAMKLDARGNTLWNVTHSQSSLCGGMWGRTPVALDAVGNLVVVGAEFNATMDNWNPLLLKLNPASGAQLSRMLFDLGPFASFDAVAVRASDLYILAHTNPNNGNPHVVHTLKIAPAGTITWSDSFIPSVFWGTRGGIVVTECAVYTAAGGKVMAHNFEGGILWEKEMILPNGGSALATDAAGNIYLAVQNGVAKFDAAGNSLGVISSISGQVSDLDVDPLGNIYVVGSTVGSRGSDIITQKYNPSGNLVWSTIYGKSGQYSDDGIAITVGGGFVYVGGSKYNKNLDMCTLKYTAGN